MMIKEPTAPASPAQVSYLEALVKDRELPAICERYQLLTELGALTKGRASEFIDQLLTAPKKAHKATVMSQPAPVIPNLVPQLSELPKFGYYKLGEDALYYWDVTGKDAYPQLRKLQILTTYTGAKKGSWKKVYSGYKDAKVAATWKPYAGKGYYTGEKTGQVSVPKILAEAVTAGFAPLTQAEAGKLGKQFGFCVRCGATLTDPVSVADGIGPVCKTYWF
jgi:hypothetical protein